MHRSQTSRAGSPETSTASSGSATDPPNPSVPADKYVDRYLEYRKALLIKILMDMVGEYLDETICTLEEATDCEGQAPNDSGRSGSRGIKRAASHGNMNPGHKRQNRGDDEEEDHFDDDDRDDREPNRKKTKPDPESEKPRFACPFYKRDPQRYKNHRACRGPGWSEMHRLKQGKQDKQDKLDDAGRWFEIYHILFGDVNIGDLPSPYYEDASGSSSGTSGPAAPGALQTQYRHFLRREIPNMVKRELEAEVAKSFKDVGSTMQGRLTTMIQNSAAKCAKIFEYIPTPSEAASHGDPDDGGDRLKPRESPPPPPSAVVPLPTTDNFIVLPDDLLDYNFEIDFNLEALSSFYPSGDAQTFDPCFQAIDSAYESGSIGGSSGTYMT
ncbi:hypothetical protein K4K58_010753 [Colletotrichum sp. SAR11_239]|nr:hypothetical protein K4K58_010753 [Colletotrichum sp. SAR11_239]